MIYTAVRITDTAINHLDQFCRDAAHHSMRGDISCDNCTSSNHGPLPNSDTVCNYSSSTQPNIIFDHNPFRCDTLVDEGTTGIIKYMIHSNDLCKRRCIHAITNLYSTLSAYDRIFTDQAVSSNFDSRLGHISKIVYMQDRAMHNNGTGSDLDTIGTSMQVGILVNVNALAKLDLISKSHSHTALNGSGPIHV